MPDGAGRGGGLVGGACILIISNGSEAEEMPVRPVEHNEEM